MLPITNRRGIHIPHSLATAAAIVALLTALGWDASEQIGAEAPSAADGMEQITVTSQPDNDAQNEAAGGAHAGAGNGEAGALSGLLPLVLPSISGI